MSTPLIDRWLHVALYMDNSISGEVVNTFSYQYGTADSRPDGVKLRQFGSDWWTYMSSAFRNVTDVAINFRRITVTDFSPTNHVQGEYAIAPVVQGLLTGDILPTGVTQCLSFKSALLSRKGRGRMYLPPTSEDEDSAGLWVNGYINFTNALGTSLLIFSGNSDLHVIPVVASRKALIVSRINSVAGDAYPDIQRRRMIGRGR